MHGGGGGGVAILAVALCCRIRSGTLIFRSDCDKMNKLHSQPSLKRGILFTETHNTILYVNSDNLFLVNQLKINQSMLITQFLFL